MNNIKMNNIKEAPFFVGANVKVKNNPADETFDQSYIGRFGTVHAYNYEGGCGQTYPDDPIIQVKFGENDFESFWKEELELIEKA